MAIADEWFANILQLNDRDTLFIPVVNKAEQTQIKKAITNLRNSYRLVDPEETAKIVISRAVSDDGTKMFVRVGKESSGLLVGAIRDINGTFREVDLKIDKNRNRKIELMKKDGLGLEEIEEFLGPLNEKERRLYFG